MEDKRQDLFADQEPDALLVPEQAAEVASLMMEVMRAENPSLTTALDLYRRVEDALIESGGIEELGDLLDVVNVQIERKLDNCKGLIEYWKGQITYLDEREKMYKARKSSVKALIEWLRQRMKVALLITGRDKVKTIEGTYYFTKARVPVTIDAERMTERYAAALQKLGLRRHSVVITIPAVYGGEFEQMADNLCKLYPGASWTVTEPAYDIDGIHARWTGGEGGRKWPAWLKPGERTFTIR